VLEGGVNQQVSYEFIKSMGVSSSWFVNDMYFSSEIKSQVSCFTRSEVPKSTLLNLQLMVGPSVTEAPIISLD